jgi:hypothetical protein
VLSSMSRKGNCRDNAVAESFFATLKLELVYQSHWRNLTQAHSEVFEYIEFFYNNECLHQALRYRAPRQAFEEACRLASFSAGEKLLVSIASWRHDCCIEPGQNFVSHRFGRFTASKHFASTSIFSQVARLGQSQRRTQMYGVIEQAVTR